MGRSQRVYKKRKFYGNRYTNKSKSTDHVVQESPSLQAHVVEGENANLGLNSSCSGSKLSHVNGKNVNSEHGASVHISGNVIVNVDILSEFISKNTICKYCKCDDTLHIYEDTSVRLGLASKLIIKCKICDANNSTRTSELTRHKYYDINLRIVYGMRCIGKGQKSAEELCGMLDLPPPPKKFCDYSEILQRNLMDVSCGTMRVAAREAVEENDGNRDLTVAIDGTWQKRGHTSLHGVVVVTSPDTGKVIDFEVVSKHCRGCSLNISGHKCSKNYEGSSGGMEAFGAKNMFLRSEFERGVRYLNYLGDGDSKGYKTVCESYPYGQNVNIEKLECIGHVQKRMGARLRKLKKDLKGKVLNDNKQIGGAGRLTDAEINLLQTYYGLAIRRNNHSVKDMKAAIWASFLHKASTDEHPQHMLCPKDKDSWCGFQRAALYCTKYQHKHSLPSSVIDAIKPIYRDLTDEKLLKKCLHGQTQNLNESFNKCIWTRVPKTVFVTSPVLVIGVCDAVITFNEGASGRLKVFKEMGMKNGMNTEIALLHIDKERLFFCERAAKNSSKQARQEKRKRSLEEELEEQEDDDYNPGMH